MTCFRNEDIASAATKCGVSQSIVQSVENATHPHDAMFNLNRNPHAYLKNGAQALTAIQAALRLSQIDAPTSILDFGCGHGRVGRWMRAAFPNAVLTGADILPSAVSFYAENFAADGWEADPNVSLNDTEDRYDLIWAGSVVTHLAEFDTLTLMQKFSSWLHPRGLAVFTTHGRPATKIFRSSPPKQIEVDNLQQALLDFESDRFGYANCTNKKNYGLSFISGRWMVDKVFATNERLILFSEGGWNGFQDVVAIQKP